MQGQVLDDLRREYYELLGAPGALERELAAANSGERATREYTDEEWELLDEISNQPTEQQRMADAGDFEGIWRRLEQIPVTGYEFAGMCQHLMRAMDVACAADPDAFVEAMARRMMTMLANLTARTDWILRNQLAEHA